MQPFRFNPFGGLTDAEVRRSIVPRACCTEICDWIESGKPGIRELAGPKGRGKTTHLVYLHELFPENPLFLLREKFRPAIGAVPAGSLVFIDSIHHLPLAVRLRLYRRYRIILTTHHRRAWEYLLAGAAFQSFPIRGLDEAYLTQIIQHRIQLALAPQILAEFTLESAYIRSLLRKYGDDVRGIMNHLYDAYYTQQLPWYEH